MIQRTAGSLPLPVGRALRKLGEDIRAARRRRSIPTGLMAERAFTTRVTLHKIEQGDPSVSLGLYAAVLFVLGMIDRLRDLADSSSDEVGLDLADRQLPQRIRKKRVSSSAGAS